VDDGIILDVDVVADPDVVDIPAYDSPEPDAAIVAKGSVSNDYSIVGQIAIFAETWCFPEQCFYDGHFLKKVIFVDQK
jgi:hypothetical protein